MFDAELETAAATKSAEKSDDGLYCARCGHLVTRRRWALAPDGGHERICANPVGRMFTVVCFLEAPGATDHGAPTEEFSWFTGHAWNFAHCRGCAEHLGWRYTSDLDPPIFWGLIKDRLSSLSK